SRRPSRRAVLRWRGEGPADRIGHRGHRHHRRTLQRGRPDLPPLARGPAGPPLRRGPRYPRDRDRAQRSRPGRYRPRRARRNALARRRGRQRFRPRLDPPARRDPLDADRPAEIEVLCLRYYTTGITLLTDRMLKMPNKAEMLIMRIFTRRPR